MEGERGPGGRVGGTHKNCLRQYPVSVGLKERLLPRFRVSQHVHLGAKRADRKQVACSRRGLLGFPQAGRSHSSA